MININENFRAAIKLLAVLVILLPAFFGACNKTEHAHSGTEYTCPMHPDVRQNGPGICPVCNMDLVPIGQQTKSNELHLSASQIRHANIRTASFESETYKTGRVLNARVMADPAGSESVSSRYAGRVERLFVTEPGSRISKGQALYSIFSEELQSLQRDFQLQLKQSAAFPEEPIYRRLAESARNKLRLFGYSAAQIRALSTGSRTNPAITVYSPSAGVVTEVLTSQGQYLSAGTPVFNVENLNQLWIEADLYPGEMKEVKLGSPAQLKINGLPQSKKVTINYISPEVDPQSRLIKIRASIANDGTLQPGMAATLLLEKSRLGAVALPQEAVVRDANGAHVWIKTAEHSFQPRKVTTGEEDDMHILITSGLENAAEVVVSGAYLLSSEHMLKKGKLVL